MLYVQQLIKSSHLTSINICIVLYLYTQIWIKHAPILSIIVTYVNDV